MIAFAVKCIPPKTTAQQRGVGVNKKTGKAISFRKPEAEAAKQSIIELIRPYAPQEPLEGALRLATMVVWPYNKGHLSRKCDIGRTDLIPNTGKPDWDNWIKTYQDALKTLGFIKDDSQVVFPQGPSTWFGPVPGIITIIEPLDAATHKQATEHYNAWLGNKQ